MKRYIFSVLTACVLCLIFSGCKERVYSENSSEDPVGVSEDPVKETSEKYFDYKEDENGGITVTEYSGGDVNIVIPAQIDGKPVTSIGASAFSNREDITSVTIPDSVTKIGGSTKLTFRENYETDPDGKPAGQTQNVILTGGDVERADAFYDEICNEYTVRLTFTESGTEKFSEATGRLTGQIISVWTDDVCICSPTVNEKIVTEICTITGNFSCEEAAEIAGKINGGAFAGCKNIQVGYKGRQYDLSQIGELYKAVNGQ